MRESRILSSVRRLFLLFALLCGSYLLLGAGTDSTAGADSGLPDCVCCPVEGTGYIVTFRDTLAKEGLRIPVSTLSPLVEGDSLVVETGEITVLDFRNGQSAIYGAKTRLVIPAVDGGARPAWYERLVDSIKKSLKEPERNRIGGSVRGGQAAFWPDRGRFAPAVPIVFEWWRVRPAPVALLVQTKEGVTKLEVHQDGPGSGALAWRPPEEVFAGTVAWRLLDADGDPLGGGTFEILTEKEADAERSRFRKNAESIDLIPRSLAASVLAAADGAYLW